MCMMLLLLGVLVLCFGSGTPLPAHLTLEGQIPKVSQGIFDDAFRFPSVMDFQVPYDTMFSSWQSSSPDFQMLAGLPPFTDIPRVQVLCNLSQLTLLVDQAYHGVQLNRDDLQLGDGCNVNGYLETQFVLTYDLTECGTTRVVQNGLVLYSNFLHVNPRKSVFNWWSTPFTLPLSCTPNMPPSSSFPFPVEFPREEWNFVIQPMNSFWTQVAQSNVYERGQNLHLQVTAKASGNQQPFIQSCFVSSSSDPHFKPRAAVVKNKGCASVYHDSNRALAEYAAPTRKGAINLVLYTATLQPSEVYIHCSVLMSALGVTPGSKSCNHNKNSSRWVELSGNVDVCHCCSSRCTAVKHFNTVTKAIITTGPFHFVKKNEDAPLHLDAQFGGSDDMQSDAPVVTEYQASSLQSDAPVVTEYQASSLQSDAPVVTEYQASSLQSDAPLVTEYQASSLQSDVNEVPGIPSDAPQGVAHGMLVLSKGPVARLTMWLPGGLMTDQPLPEKDMPPFLGSPSEPRDSPLDDLQNDLPAAGGNLPMSPGSKKSDGKDASSDASIGRMPSMVDGWPISASLEKAAILKESKMKRWNVRPRTLLHVVKGYHKGLEPVKNLKEEKHQERRKDPGNADASASRPIIRSKVQITRGVDGSQTLSYEEEVVKQKEPKMRRLGNDVLGNRKMGQSAMQTFLELLRTIKVE